MFTNTITEALRCCPWKQLYLIALVDLVPAAAEKVSLIRWNIIWNQSKSTLRARSMRVNPTDQGTEMWGLCYSGQGEYSNQSHGVCLQ